MKRRLPQIILWFALLVPAVLLQAQQPVEKKYPTLLWEISGHGLKKPSYLFGTMHVSSKMVFHLSDSFYFGIRSTEVVALELDPQLWQDQLFRYENLQSNLRNFTAGSPNDYITEKSFQLESYDDQVKSALSEEPTLINGLLYRSFQPRADFEEDTYLDLYIYQTGRKLGKLATGVENYFDTERLIIEATQDMMRDKRRKGPELEGESMYEIERKTQEAYRKGDLDMLDSLERLMQPSGAFIEKFLYRRNEIQANSIDSILKRHTLFVGVGAAHLPGPRGVIELLRKKGYHLRPIHMRDRDAPQREDIDRVRVPVTFSVYKPEDARFTVKVPGRMNKRPDNRTGDSWQYADMGNGAYYMITRIKTHARMSGQDDETVLKRIDSLLYENIPGRILRKKRIEKDGWKGFDITNRTRRGDVQRYNIFETPFEIIIFKMSGNGSYVEGKEAETFFGSIELEKEERKSGWTYFEPARGGFRVQVPQQPSVCRNTTGVESSPRWEFEANDSATGDAFLIWKRSIQNYRFLEEDSFVLDLMEESFRLSDQISQPLDRNFIRWDGHPALDASYRCTDGSCLRARFILNGPNHYLLAGRTRTKPQALASFFDSFTFTSFRYPAFRNYTDSFLHICVQTPIVPDIDSATRNILEKAGSLDSLNAVNGHSNFWPRNKPALFLDDTTGEAVYISVQSFPKYYYTRDSAGFWENETNEKKIAEDFVIRSKEYFTRDGDSVAGFRYIFSDTNCSRLLRNWIFVKGHRLYRAIMLMDSLDPRNQFPEKFFATLRPLPEESQPSVFKNRLRDFFTDLLSPDSARSSRAREAISSVYFGPAGVQLLLQAIENLSPGDKDYLATKAKLIDELGFINEPVSADAVVEGLGKIYAAGKDTATIANAVVRGLARNTNASSYRLLKKLILQDPPVLENQAEYNDFFQDLADSLPLTRSFFPEFLQLVAVDDYKPGVLSLLTWLVDSNYLHAADYAPYFGQLFFDAKIQWKKQEAREEKKLQGRSEDAAGTNSPARTDPDEMEGNSLQNYATLLAPFYDSKPGIRDFFRRLIKSRDLSIRLFAATLLLRYNVNVPDSTILSIAASDGHRARLYRTLRAIQKENLFPAAYKNQEDMARSLLAEARDEDEFSAISMAGRQTVSFRGNTGYVYFFRYKIDRDDDWQMGISGIQPLDTSQLSTENILVRLTGKKFRDDQPVGEQWNTQLKRLIFSKHKSAASFYLDNDYFAGRGDDED